MAAPTNYKTLRGLVNATERALQARHAGETRKDGMSIAMWLSNAEYVARTRFGDEGSVQRLRAKYATTRVQDLQGGHSLFGIELPTRDYIVGDNIPGVGEITDVYGDQVEVNGAWYHKLCFEKAA